MRRGRAVVFFLLLGAAGAAAAQTEWGLEAGYGFSVQLNRGRSEERLFLFEPSYGVKLGSRLEYVVEGHFARYFSPTGYMVGLMPLTGRFYFGSGRVLAYVSVGAGFGWTDLVELDEIDRRFNFLLQGSLGVRGAVGNGSAWTLEARFSHVSNARTASPNLGLNCVVLLAGWRFRP